MDPTRTSTTHRNSAVYPRPVPTRKLVEPGVDGAENPRLGSARFERQSFIDLVTDHFLQNTGCHGVVYDRLLLFGIHGTGKRRIATQAALQVARLQTRKILWVDSHSFDAFLRDYRRAYVTITGAELPRSLNYASALFKVKHILEQRREEWLLVLFDVDSYFERCENSCGFPLSVFLPDRGQILMTSSWVARAWVGEGLQFEEALICRLRIGATATELLVEGLADDELRIYPRPDLASLAKSKRRRLGFFSGMEFTTPLFLTLTAANMQLLGLSITQYRKFFRNETVLEQTTKFSAMVATNSSMSILWDAIGDHDRWALRLLAVASVVDHRDIPLFLIEKLRTFAGTTSQRLTPAFEMLLSIDLMTKGAWDDGSTTVSLHPLVYRWIRAKLQNATGPRSTYGLLASEWIAVLDDYLRLTPTQRTTIYDPDRWWKLAPHIRSITDFKPLDSFPLPRVISFLVNVAEFLVEDELTAKDAGSIITDAYIMSNLVYLDAKHIGETICGQVEYDKVHIHHIRARVHLQTSKALQAENELLNAELAIDDIKDLDTSKLERESEEIDVRICIVERRYHSAERLLDRMLENPEAGVDDMSIARRHCLMAWALRGQDCTVAALQHSHAAMCYWQKLPEDKRWSPDDDTILEMIERHASLLMDFAKFNGALLFFPRLLDIYLELAPGVSVNVMRAAFYTVHCYAELHKLPEAEEVVCRVLEQASIHEMGGERLSFALLMLHEIGRCYGHLGRVVEAEGIFRFNLKTKKTLDPKKETALNSRHIGSRDLLWLATCLLQQGKHEEVRLLRERYDYTTPEHYTRHYERAIESDRTRRRIYQLAYWAEEDGTTDEFNALLGEGETTRRLKWAVRNFGDFKQRIEDGRDIDGETDPWHVREARKNRILRLIDQSLVYLSFSARSPQKKNDDDDEEEEEEEDEEQEEKKKKEEAEEGKEKQGEHSEEMWCDPKQRVIGEFWRWCECRRKRVRSGSINPVDLAEKAHYRQLAAKEIKPLKTLKQTKITDWVKVLERPSPPLAEGCSADCPCIAANKAGLAAYAELESKLWVHKEDTAAAATADSPASAKPRHRYRQRTPNEAWPKDEAFHGYNKWDWKWMRLELWNGDHEGENFIVSHSLYMPSITVTPAEGYEKLPLVKCTDKKDQRITKFFKEPGRVKVTLVRSRDGRSVEWLNSPSTKLDMIDEDARWFSVSEEDWIERIADLGFVIDN